MSKAELKHCFRHTDEVGTRQARPTMRATCEYESHEVVEDRRGGGFTRASSKANE